MKSFDVEPIKERQKEYYKFTCPVCKDEFAIDAYLQIKLSF